jgi:hypothetical protein
MVIPARGAPVRPGRNRRPKKKDCHRVDVPAEEFFAGIQLHAELVPAVKPSTTGSCVGRGISFIPNREKRGAAYLLS